MSILPGFQKYKRHIRIGDDYILDSEWTHAKTVEMSDGSTLDDTVANINREITATKKSVSDGKSAVASAITAQGVTTAADATFDVMAANVGKVGTDKYNTGYNAGVADTKVGTATAAQVLSGKTFTNASSVGLTGTMADYSANPQTVTLSSSQTGTSTLSLPTGYHSSVKVNAANVYNAGKASVSLSNYIMTLNAAEGQDYSFGASPQRPNDMADTFVGMSAIYFWDINHSGAPDITVRLGYGANLTTIDANRWYTYADIVELQPGFASAGSYIHVESWPSGSNMRVFAKFG
ncbi:MAG: hypothetical protein HDQ95_07725 [Roseburia sp.]|nr:hypothetical protein [Roseburia sp.]